MAAVPTGARRRRQILFIRQHLGSVGSAGSIRAWEQIGRLSAEGHSVTVVSGREIDAAGVPPGVVVKCVPTKYNQSMSFLRRRMSFLSFALRATAVAVRGAPDIVFATSTPILAFFPALVAKLRHRRCRLVLEVRDLWPEVPIAMGAVRNPIEARLAMAFARFSYRRADQMIGLSPGMCDGIYTASGRRATLVPNGSSISTMAADAAASDELRRSLGVSADQMILLYAGSVGVVNDPSYIAGLAMEISRISDSIHIVIVGSGSEFPQLRLHLADVDRCHVRDGVDRTEIANYYSVADASLVSFIPIEEMEANSANKFFDSLASGTPVCINYGGWHSDLLADAGAGIVLARDPAAAARQVVELFADSETLAVAERGARDLASSFEWDVLYPIWRKALLGVATVEGCDHGVLVDDDW